LAASVDDPKSVTRDYVVDFDRRGAPLLSIYGGKLTTYRKLAQQVVDQLCPVLGHRAAGWTAGVPLPGGDMPQGDFAAFEATLAAHYPWLPSALRHRYARAYGTRIERLLGSATTVAGLGAEVLPGLYQHEIDYLREAEFARSADDILFRRSKLGVHLGPDAVATLDAWLARG
jgi:glycerol-3-phosphate dehydrogenase